MFARGLLVLVFTSGLVLSPRVARAETVPSPSPTATVEDPPVFDVGGRIRASISDSEWFGDLVASALGLVFDMGRPVFCFLAIADNVRVQDLLVSEARGYRLSLVLAHEHIAQTSKGGGRVSPQYPAQSGAQYPAQYPAQWRVRGAERTEMPGEAE